MDMYQLKQIPSEAKIRKYLRVAIFGSSKLFCPECHQSNPVVYEYRYRCRRCRCKFSLLSHTWLSNLKLPLQQWWLVLWCWTQKIPVTQASNIAKLWIDGASIYKRVEEYWPVQHTVDIYKKFKFEHASEIEGTFGNLRTFIRRMYHHVTPEKFPDYVREFCFRFSTPELFESPKLYCEKTLILVPTR
jgi:hypothetical protein